MASDLEREKFLAVPLLTGAVYRGPIQASVGLCLTKSQLLWAKKSGCPGFKDAKIWHNQALPWLRENIEKLFEPENDKNALECRKLRLQCLALEEANERERKSFVPLEDHQNEIKEIVTRFQNELYSLAPILPVDLAGNPLYEMEKRILFAFDKLILSIKNNSVFEKQ